MVRLGTEKIMPATGGGGLCHPIPKRNLPRHIYNMQTFLIWLTLKENVSTDPASYDQVFLQQLEAIKDKIPTEIYQKLK
jgi:hypothetical protein